MYNIYLWNAIYYLAFLYEYYLKYVVHLTYLYIAFLILYTFVLQWFIEKINKDILKY